MQRLRTRVRLGSPMHLMLGVPFLVMLGGPLFVMLSVSVVVSKTLFVSASGVRDRTGAVLPLLDDVFGVCHRVAIIASCVSFYLKVSVVFPSIHE
jgi:hypothetical protein